MSGRLWIGAVVAAAAIVLVVLWPRSVPPTGQSAQGNGPSQSQTDASAATGLATYRSRGYAFDYPAAWQMYPLRMVASFFSVEAYLASEPIDTAKICQTTPNSTSCNFHGYDLHPGQVAIEIAGWGAPMDDPLAFWDRPTDGRRIVVGGAPAIVSQEAIGADRVVLTWKVARPDSVDNWIQLDADVLGPDAGLAKAQVDALIASFRFDQPPTQLDPMLAAQVGDTALHQLRANDPEAYACFPPAGRSVLASVTALPGAALRQPLPAMCSTTIAPTDLGFWRMVLTAGWGADPAHPQLHYTTVQWLQADGTPTLQSSGGDTLPYCCRG